MGEAGLPWPNSDNTTAFNKKQIQAGMSTTH